MSTSSSLHSAVVRLRVISVVYGVAWIAMPATFFALVIAEPSFAVLHVADAQVKDAAASVALMFAFAFVVVLWISPVFVWALATASRSAGGSHAHPLLLGACTFVLPYFPLGTFVMNATSTLARAAGSAGEARAVAWWIAWSGALLLVPTMFLMGATAAIDMDDPPASVVVMCGALVVYAMTRILIARRVFHLCRDMLLQRDVDAMRASHAEPVGGG
jgi:hypothetical protein